MLKSREQRKLKEILRDIQECDKIDKVQRLVKNFALYREGKLKEKVGDLHSITPLFELFNGIPEFQFSIEDNKYCKCNHKHCRSFEFAPLTLITIQNLKDSQGNITRAVNEKLISYSNKSR